MKAKRVEKAYFEEWKKKRGLVVEDGIIYRYEVRNRASIRQLHMRVVPPKLCCTVIMVCHVSTMAGHSGVHRMMYQVITWFWWPCVMRDSINEILGCANVPGKSQLPRGAQMHLYAFACNKPSSMIFLDRCKPGNVPEKDQTREVLTMLDGMTGFDAG
jgi:hypothetical protein